MATKPKPSSTKGKNMIMMILGKAKKADAKEDKAMMAKDAKGEKFPPKGKKKAKAKR